jgi:hypothetical protein
MSDHSKNDVHIYIHIDGGSGQGGDVLPALTEFIGQVYPKLDFIISQGEQILAAGGGGGNVQQTIDNLTAQVKQLTESQAQSQQNLQQKIEESK